MATLKGSTIGSTFDSLVKRADTWVQTGTNIELMDDSHVIKPTGLYLESGNAAGIDNVGIGKAVPLSKLTVEVPADWNNNDPAVHIINKDVSGGHGHGLLVQAGGGEDYVLQCQDYVGNCRLYVHRDGKVGIGTASPDYNLHIEGTNPRIRLESTTSANDKYDFGWDSGNDKVWFAPETNDADVEFQNKTGSSLLMILHGGNVGIGTTAPDEKLHVSAGAVVAGTALATAGGSEVLISHYTPGDQNWISLIATESSSGAMAVGYACKPKVGDDDSFVSTIAGSAQSRGCLVVGKDLEYLSSTGDTTTAIGSDVTLISRFYIDDANGNVGIGTDTPDTTLEVVGSFAANGPSSTFVTFADGDATPSVATGNIFKHHASTQTINMFDGGVCGQIITVISTAAITYDFNASNLKCGTADIVTASGDVTVWVFDGTNWYLLSWMDVSIDLSSGGF